MTGPVAGTRLTQLGTYVIKFAKHLTMYQCT